VESSGGIKADVVPVLDGGEDAAMPDLINDPELAVALQMSLAEAEEAPKDEEDKAE
jgi:hypothetical protein